MPDLYTFELPSGDLHETTAKTPEEACQLEEATARAAGRPVPRWVAAPSRLALAKVRTAEFQARERADAEAAAKAAADAKAAIEAKAEAAVKAAAKAAADGEVADLRARLAALEAMAAPAPVAPPEPAK